MEKESKIYRVLSKVYLILFVFILVGLYVNNFIFSYYHCYIDSDWDFGQRDEVSCRYGGELSDSVVFWLRILLVIFVIFDILLSPIVAFFSAKYLNKEIKKGDFSWKKLFKNLSFYNLFISSSGIFYFIFSLVMTFFIVFDNFKNL
jgi:hypothetical protein